jgi:hypothetical protein
MAQSTRAMPWLQPKTLFVLQATGLSRIYCLSLSQKFLSPDEDENEQLHGPRNAYRQL